MKSINKKKFSLQDFEKGLMLAGYIAPSNAGEVIEKEIIDEHDKKVKQEKKAIYFKRTVLAAEIVNELKNERTFGRVKFQKMVYLCENVIHMNLSDDRYKKFAAGPFDNRFMHSINKEFKKQKWFDVKIVEDNNYRKQQYIDLEQKDKYKKYYENYFSDNDNAIHKIISLFKTQKTDFVELVATLFYCWKEIIDDNQGFSIQLMHDKFYNWATEKNRFSGDEIDNAIEWMKNNKLTPQSI